MSRSYKKHPYYTDGKNGQVIAKRFANKTVRHYKHKIPKGKAYKKLFCSYEIHDYITRWSWREAEKDYETDSWSYLKEKWSTKKEFYQHWNKYYKRK